MREFEKMRETLMQSLLAAHRDGVLRWTTKIGERGSPIEETSKH